MDSTAIPDESAPAITSPAEDSIQWLPSVREAFGTNDAAVIDYLIRTAVGILGQDMTALKSFIAGVRDLQPQDHTERLLVSQMMLVHHKACALLASSAKAILTETQESLERRAEKFMRLYLQQAEALRKYRRNASQTITVNHVQANQAVVANTLTTVREHGGGSA